MIIYIYSDVQNCTHESAISVWYTAQMIPLLGSSDSSSTLVTCQNRCIISLIIFAGF